ncbi:MAG: RAMP superfamily CRISPR-associated protein [Candidatus Thorarchaeota archaeon]
MSFKIENIKGFFIASSPIVHQGDEKTGSEKLFNRQRVFVDEKEKIEELPFISGNAIRGIWRRLIMKDLLNLIGMNEINSSRNYHMLFSGGILESVSEKDSGTINLELKQKVRELIIPISLFGTMYKNQSFGGKLQVGFLIPICKEYHSLLPSEDEMDSEFKTRLKKSIHTYRDFQFQTRMDDLKEERKDDENAIQMLFRFEVLISGTGFFHEIKVIDPSNLELSALSRVFELWYNNSTIGGKSNTGFGNLKGKYNFNKSSEEYLKFVEENKKEIVSLLLELK